MNRPSTRSVALRGVRRGFPPVAILSLFMATLNLPGRQSITSAVSLQTTIGLFAYVKLGLLLVPLIGFALVNVDAVFRQLRSAILPLLLIGIYGVLTALFSPAPSASFIRAASLVILILDIAVVVAVARTVSCDGGLLFILRHLLLACSVIVGFFALGALFHFGPAWRTIYVGTVKGYRLGGDIIPPNTLGAVAAINLVLLLRAKALHIRTWTSIPLLAASALVLLESGSRGALLSLILSGTLTYGLSTVLTAKRLRLAVLFLAIAAAFGAALYFSSFPQLVTSVLRDASRTGHASGILTFSGRTAVWSAIIDNTGTVAAFLGHGYSLVSSSGSVAASHMITMDAHNGYLQVYAGLGLVGTVLLLVFVGAVLVEFRSVVMALRSRHAQVFVFLHLFLLVMCDNVVEASIGGEVVAQTIVLVIAALEVATLHKSFVGVRSLDWP